MAAKVNIKFVVILSVALLALAAGVGVLGATVLFKSAEDNIRRGDEYAAQGNYIEAAKSYGKAVHKEGYNTQYIRKWLGAIEQSIPPTDVEYRAMYFQHYLGALRQLSVVDRNDPEAQRAVLEATFRQLKISGATAESWARFGETVATSLEGLDMNDPGAQRLLRYRGLGAVYRFRNLDTVPQAERDQAREDLKAALAADPSDIECELALVEMQSTRAMALYRAGRGQDSAAAWDEATASINRLVERFPQSPRVILRRALMIAERAIQTARTEPEQRRVSEELRAEVLRAIEAARGAPAEDLDEQFLAQLGRATSLSAGGSEVAERWFDLVDYLAAREPGNAQFLLERAKALVMLDRHEEAIEQFEAVATMPDIPVSLEGLILRELRVEARRLQVESALALWSQAEAGDREAAMARVKRYRDVLAERVAADSPSLLRVDAQIAFSERRLDDAVDALTSLRNATRGDDTEVLLMLGRALEAQQKIGAAAEQYRRVHEREPGNLGALLALINLEIRSGNRDIARQLLTTAERLAPGNEVVARTRSQLELLHHGVAAPEDPVLTVLNGSLRLRTSTPPEFAVAIEMIDRAIEQYPGDPRLILERITLENQTKGRDAALALARAARERFPNSEQLAQFELFLTYDDPIEARAELINRAELTDLQRHVSLAALYFQSGRSAQGDAELGKARAMAPDDPMVLELDFARALEKQDFAAGLQMAQRAARINADGVGGQIYQARLELAEGKYDMAVATLDRVTREDEFNIGAWRFLGSAQLGAGRVEDGLRAYDRALKIKPDDAPTILAYANALSSVGRNAEALALVRKASGMGINDPGIGATRLEFEERFGDPRYAIEQRLRMRSADPGDRSNNLALAQLFTREGRLAEARSILNSTRVDTGKHDLAFALVEARLLAAEGRVDEAVERVEQEIARMPADRRGEGYVVLADFLFERQRPEDAVDALEQARGSQGPLMAVDRKLGDYAFNIGDFERAVAAYRSVVAGGADREAVVAKRLAESHMRLGQLDEAEKVIADVEKAGGEDSQTILLRAQIALDRQNDLEARRLLDRAIEKNPRNPIAFLRRAQLGLTDDSQFAAVLRDLRQAAQLQPDNIVVRQMLSQVFIRRGRINEAIDELAQAVSARPDNDALRYEYIRMLGQHAGADRMLAAIQQAVNERGEDAPQWFTLAGDTLLASGDPARAIPLYEQAHRVGQSPQTLMRLVQGYLGVNPPRTAQAAQALAAFNSGGADQQFLVALLRARVEAAAGNSRQALQLLAQTWEQSGDTPAKSRLWFELAGAAFGANLRDFIAFIEQLPPQTPNGTTPAARVMLASIKASDPSQARAVLSSLNGVEDETDDPNTILGLARARGQAAYVAGDFRAAADAYRLGLTIAPTDAQLNNNLAYTIARQLNDPQGALAYATKAAESAPLDANVLDTLGYIYLMLNRHTQADATFQRALSSATTDMERVPVLAHLALARKRMGDASAAANFARQAVQLGETTRGAADLYSTELNDAQAIINGR